MALFGDLVKGALGGFPEKPRVPIWADITLAEEQQKAIEANQKALPGAEELASGVNSFNQQQISQMLRFAIPNYDSLTKTASGNIESLLRGEIPKDVQDRLQISDAAKALGGGYSGSGMHGNLLARDLGLTSLSLTEQGLGSAESWIRTMASLYEPGMMNVTSMFVTPQQMFQDTYQNQSTKWNVQWLRNQLKALPDPYDAAIASDVGSITDSFASALSAYVGGMGGVGGAVGGAIGMGAGGGSGSATNMLNGVYHNDPNTGAGVWFNSQPYAGSSGGGGGL